MIFETLSLVCPRICPVCPAWKFENRANLNIRHSGRVNLIVSDIVIDIVIDTVKE